MKNDKLEAIIVIAGKNNCNLKNSFHSNLLKEEIKIASEVKTEGVDGFVINFF